MSEMKYIVRSINPMALVILLSAGSAFGPLALAHEGEAHGNHDAAHGGLVLMYSDIHYELVMLPRGGFRLYYSDAMRNELPAATASNVSVEIETPEAETTVVDMVMSEGGDYWEGKAPSVEDPDTIVRLSFVYRGERLVFDIPAAYLPEADPVPERPATVAGTW